MSLRRTALLAAALLAHTATAGAACTQAVSCKGGAANDAAMIVSACCGATSCTLDGTITLAGPVCNLDFDGHSVTLSGQLIAGSSTLLLTAASLQITTGTLAARGAPGQPGGAVTITTTGRATTALAMTGSGSIDVSGSDAGTLTVEADGGVSLAAGSIVADGTDDAASGGTITIDASADPGVHAMLLAGRLSADSGVNGGGGTVTVRAPGALTVRNLVSAQGGFDFGTIDLEAAGATTIDTGATLDASAVGGSAGDGGAITIDGQAITVNDTVEASADADGGGGDVELTASAGAIRTSGAGIAANGDSGTVALVTENPSPSGDITLGAPLSAQATDPNLDDATGSGMIALQAAGSITVGKNLWANGNGAGNSEVDLDARGDVLVGAPIAGNDPAGGGSLFVRSGRDTTFGANVQMRSGTGSIGSGGQIEAAAGDVVTVVGTGTQLDVTGASGDGGTIVLAAEGSVTLGSSTQILADSSAPGGAGGVVRLSGGTRCDARLCDPSLDPSPARDVAGGLTVNGKVSATPGPSSGIELAGCTVAVGSNALVTSGGGNNTVIGRSAITLQGKVTTAAPGANALVYRSGVTPSLAGSIIPPPRVPDAIKPSCTGSGDPPGCLDPCPQCGNGGQPEFPEQCDGGPGNVPCTSGCDAHCRSEPASDDGNPCTIDNCDAFGPYHANVPDFTADLCGPDPTTTCPRVCITATPTAPAQCTVLAPPECNDGNPCTWDCMDPAQNACIHPPHDGPGVAGCDDGNPCTGAEKCNAGTCQPGTPVSCPAGEVCDRSSGGCVAKPCTTNAQCDDANPCTQDTCVAGFCSNTPDDALSCSDGNACNGAETCQGGTCVHGPPPNCDDGNICTDDSCDSTRGCVHTPVAGCCETAADCGNDVTCPLACNPTTHTCGLPAQEQGCCHPGSADCDDGNPCTTDVNNKTCPGKPNNTCATKTNVTDGTPCGTTCEPGTCTGSTCQTQPLTCTPSTDACVEVACREGTGCVSEPIDQCCHTAGADPACDDGNACTLDTCADVGLAYLVCQHVTTDLSCRPCATDTDCAPHGRCDGQACSAGVCTKTPAACDDGNVDTEDICTLDAGLQPHCQHFCLDDRGCSDGNACNGQETCDVAAGTCHPGTPVTCDDGDACDGVETCDPASGRCLAGQALTGYPGLTCQVTAMQAALARAAPGDLAAGLRRKLTNGLGKLAGTLAGAQKGGKPRRVNKLLAAAARLARSLQHQVDAARRKRKPQIAAALAAQLDTRLGSTTAALGQLTTGGH